MFRIGERCWQNRIDTLAPWPGEHRRITAIAAACAAVATAAKQRHLTTIALQHDLGGVFFDALWSVHLRVCNWPST